MYTSIDVEVYIAHLGPLGHGERMDTAKLAGHLRIISEPNRLRILDLLMEGEQCNCDLGDRLGLAPNLVSHHLSVLAGSGLIRTRRDPFDARWIHYSMNPEALDELNAALAVFFDPARIKAGDTACRPRGEALQFVDRAPGPTTGESNR